MYTICIKFTVNVNLKAMGAGRYIRVNIMTPK